MATVLPQRMLLGRMGSLSGSGAAEGPLFHDLGSCLAWRAAVPHRAASTPSSLQPTLQPGQPPACLRQRAQEAPPRPDPLPAPSWHVPSFLLGGLPPAGTSFLPGGFPPAARQLASCPPGTALLGGLWSDGHCFILWPRQLQALKERIQIQTSGRSFGQLQSFWHPTETLLLVVVVGVFLNVLWPGRPR